MGKNGQYKTTEKPGVTLHEFPVSKGLSNIEDYEMLEAKDFVDREFIKLTGKPFQFKTAGWYIAVKIHVRDEELKVVERDDGTKATIWMPPQYLEQDKYHSCAALVCGLGPSAYKDKEKFPTGPWCRVGDFVSIPRQNCYLQNYRGVAFGLVPDDSILGVIDDPNDVTPINQKSLF